MLKNIEDAEAALWKENQQKQLLLQDGLESLKASVKENNDGINEVLIDLTKRLDDSELKYSGIVKLIEPLNVPFRN